MKTELRHGEVWFMPNDKAKYHAPNVKVKMSQVLAQRLIEQGHGEIISDSNEAEPAEVKAEPAEVKKQQNKK